MLPKLNGSAALDDPAGTRDEEVTTPHGSVKVITWRGVSPVTVMPRDRYTFTLSTNMEAAPQPEQDAWMTISVDVARGSGRHRRVVGAGHAVCPDVVLVRRRVHDEAQ